MIIYPKPPENINFHVFLKKLYIQYRHTPIWIYTMRRKKRLKNPIFFLEKSMNIMNHLLVEYPFSMSVCTDKNSNFVLSLYVNLD